VSTDADANAGPILKLRRNSASPADNDLIGAIDWTSENSSGDEHDFLNLTARMRDVTAGSEDVAYAWTAYLNGTGREIQSFVNTDASAASMVFNEDSQDIDFRVESNGNANMLFVDGGNDAVGIGTNSPSRKLSVFDSSAPYLALQNSTSGSTTSDGLQFQLASANSYLWNYENGFMALATNNAERFRIGTSGQLGIGGATYGTSGQVLTSGGSGAAPSWANASGAGKFSATADGAIAIGKPVTLQANGTVKQITETVSDLGTPVAYLNTSQNLGASGNSYGYQPSMAYFSQYKFLYAVYVYNNNAYLRSYSYNETNGHLTGATTRDTQQANEFGACVTLAYDPVRLTMGLLVQQSSVLKLYLYYVQSDASVGSNVVTVTSNSINSDTTACLVCDRATGYYHVFYNLNDGTVRASLYTPVVSANGTVTSITTLASGDQIYGATQRFMSAAKDESSTSDFMLVTKRLNDKSMMATYFTHTSSGVSNVGGVIYESGTTTGNQATSIAYNTEDAKFVVTSNYGNPSHAHIYTLLKPSSTGGNPTLSGSAINYTTSNLATNVSSRLLYDPKVKDVLVCYWDNSTNQIRIRRVDSSGTSPTVGTVLTSKNVDGSGYLLNDFVYLDGVNRYMVYGRDTGSNGNSSAGFRVSTSSSNNTDWIGFAESAISDTVSGDILVLGSVAENQSGLTIGSTYYVQIDGTLDTASVSAIKAGRAIAADKLLITEGNTA